MSRFALFGLIAIVALLVGASMVFAQDSTQPAPGSSATAPTCLSSGINIQQMQQMHDAMGQNVPEGMQQMHDAMGQALQSGDPAQIQQMQNICRTQHGVQQ